MKNSQTTVRQQAKRTSSSGSGHHLSSRGATRAQHHETAGFHRPRRHILEDPTKSWQKHVQQHMPRVLPTGAAKQVQLACARWRVQNGPSLWPGAAQTCTFHLTTCLPLHQPRRPIWTWCGVRRVQDKCVPSDAEQPATPRRRCGRRLGEQCQWRGLTSVASMASCMPPNSGRPSATTSSRRPSSACASRSRSRTITLVETRAPASRHTLATAFSTQIHV